MVYLISLGVEQGHGELYTFCMIYTHISTEHFQAPHRVSTQTRKSYVQFFWVFFCLSNNVVFNARFKALDCVQYVGSNLSMVFSCMHFRAFFWRFHRYEPWSLHGFRIQTLCITGNTVLLGPLFAKQRLLAQFFRPLLRSERWRKMPK